MKPSNKASDLVFSSTAAVYGQAAAMPLNETAPTQPESPYGASKQMSERMLTDVAAATGLRYVILRYFNVAGADPQGRLGQRTQDATHLIKVACEVVVGKRPRISVFGTDYPTADGTCVRDYIHIEYRAISSKSWKSNPAVPRPRRLCAWAIKRVSTAFRTT